MKIFGIDPGTHLVGCGVIDAADRAPRLIKAEILTASRNHALPDRLVQLGAALRESLREARPDVVVVEKAFFGRNVASLIALGEGRGVALLCAAELHVPIHEYSPAEIKKAVTGTGGARKEQVASMVRSLLRAPIDLRADATDALAAALCHAHRLHLPAAMISQDGLVLAWRRKGKGRRGRGR